MKRNLIKIVPLALAAFLVLVPFGAMASSPYYGQDYSTLSGSSVSWNSNIREWISSVPRYDTFQWYNEFHNANGGTTVYHPVLTATTALGTDNDYLPDLGPYFYTSNFQYTTTNAKATLGQDTLYVTHTYAQGSSIMNSYQTYNGV